MSAPIAIPGQTITFDPTVSPGLTAPVNTTVYSTAGAYCWVKFDTSNTAWRPVPVSIVVSSDPSVAPGLKAPIGFRVMLPDGSAAWVKSGTSDTAWSTDPNAGAQPAAGPNLTDSDATINPAALRISASTLPVSVLTGPRALTLGLTGTVAGYLRTYQVIRRDLSANTYTVKDDAGTTLYTFLASPTGPEGATFYFNGTHFAFLSCYFVA